jgi:Helicase conserved C-terminal domain
VECELEKAADQVVKNIESRTKALCFTPTINEAKVFAELCRDRGVPSDYVSGECYDRTEKIARFRNGETKLLCNCAVLTEGFDCPDIDTIVLLRPTQSRALLCQQIGRATRLCPDKEFGLLLDFFLLTARHRLCAPSDLNGVEKEAPLCDKAGPGGQRKSLADELSVSGVDQESEYDPLSNEPADPFDVDAYFDEPHLFVDPYRLAPPSENQVAALNKLGIPIVRIKNRGIVDALFTIFKRRWNRNLATVPQVRFLKILGHPDPWNATFSDATEFISERRRSR